MSGLEGLAAFGLACNVMQAITFAKEGYQVARDILESGSPYPQLGDAAKRIGTVTEKMETSLKNVSDELSVTLAARRCVEIASEIDATLDSISSSTAKGSLGRAVAGAFKSTTKARRLKRLEGLMSKLQHEFVTHVLVHLSKQQDLSAIHNTEGFTNMDALLHQMRQNLSQDHAKLRDDIIQRLDAIKARITEEAAKSRAEADKRLELIEASQDREAQRKGFLESLHYPEMNERRNYIADKYHPGTYEWLSRISRDTDPNRRSHTPEGVTEFIQWLRSEPADPQPFWICGKAGSGKSTFVWYAADDSRLAKIVQDSPTDGDGVIVASHFLWEMGSENERNVRGTLCSLIHQLASRRQAIVERLVAQYPQLTNMRYLGDWSESLLTSVLFAACQLISDRIFIFLDGLDEIMDSNVPKLFDLVSRLSSWERLKVCASSRPENRFIKFFAASQRFHMQQVTWDDMAMYCYHALSVMDWEDDLSEQPLVHEICRKSEGVFLWAILAVQALQRGHGNGDDWETQRKRLELLPTGLFPLYQQMWARLNQDQGLYRREAATYFRLYFAWDSLRDRTNPTILMRDYDPIMKHLTVAVIGMCFAPKRTQEVLDALPNLQREAMADLERQISEAPGRIATRCAGLLELVEGDRVQIIHRSASEFLTGTSEGQEILAHDKTVERILLERLLSGSLAEVIVQSRAMTGCQANLPISQLAPFTRLSRAAVIQIHNLYLACPIPERQHFRFLDYAHSVLGYTSRNPQNAIGGKEVIAWVNLLILFNFVEYFPTAAQQLNKLGLPVIKSIQHSLLESFVGSLVLYSNRTEDDLHRTWDFLERLGLKLCGHEAALHSTEPGALLGVAIMVLAGHGGVIPEHRMWSRHNSCSHKGLSQTTAADNSDRLFFLLKRFLNSSITGLETVCLSMSNGTKVLSKDGAPSVDKDHWTMSVVPASANSLCSISDVSLMIDGNIAYQLRLLIFVFGILGPRPWTQLSTEIYESFQANVSHATSQMPTQLRLITWENICSSCSDSYVDASDSVQPQAVCSFMRSCLGVDQHSWALQSASRGLNMPKAFSDMLRKSCDDPAVQSRRMACTHLSNGHHGEKRRLVTWLTPRPPAAKA